MGRPWIKLSTSMFDDEKIKLIELMPEGDSLLVIWLKLLCFAGKTDNDGVFRLNKEIPYNAEMLAGIFNRKLSTVRTALDVFQEFGMVTIIDDAYALSNWPKYQSDSPKARKRTGYGRKNGTTSIKNHFLKAVRENLTLGLTILTLA